MSANNNPVTGTFGTGNIRIFGGKVGVTVTDSWQVPPGINKCRVRGWGGGAYGYSLNPNGGSGGGFFLKTISDLSGVTSVPVTIGMGGHADGVPGGTTSFGSYASATGGSSTSYNSPGGGVGGDINSSGGTAETSTSGGGGAGNLFGNGGNGRNYVGGNGASGGGAGNSNTYPGGNGFSGQGGTGFSTTGSYTPPTSGQEAGFSIDLIGTGGGGSQYGNGINGGGGGYPAGSGGYPGGGGAYGSGLGGPGMLIVEY